MPCGWHRAAPGIVCYETRDGRVAYGVSLDTGLVGMLAICGRAVAPGRGAAARVHWQALEGGSPQVARSNLDLDAW